MTLSAPLAVLREKLAEANANVTDRTAQSESILAEAARAQRSIDEAKSEAASYENAIALLEAQEPVGFAVR